MDIRVRNWSALSDTDRRALTAKKQFSDTQFRGIRRRVQRIIRRIKNDGDDALRYFSRKYNHYPLPSAHANFVDAILVSAAERRHAKKHIAPKVKAALDLAIKNARIVQSASHSIEGSQINDIEGVRIHHQWHPIPSAGLYVPQGKGCFPSMMVMLGVPAQLAGVDRITVMTPPNVDGSIDPATLYVADSIGITNIYKIGGAQAIAAMAYGTETIAAVDKIFGPGNMYVTFARYLLQEVMNCGMPAGPSESMIIADAYANPHICAADLMIEAEHGSDSMAFLVTPSKELAAETCHIISQKLAHIPSPRREYIRAVLCNYGGIIQSVDIAQAVEIANAFAPEHLKIDARQPRDIAPHITSAGEILLGEHSAFSIANYLTGANSILPTNRDARTWSAISVHDFCVHRSQIEIQERGFAHLSPYTVALAEYEGFYAHAHAIKFRNAQSE